MSPVPSKMFTIQLLIQKKVNGIVFDNDTKRCYDRIASGVALETLRRMGYSIESVRMLGLLWAQIKHHICTGFGVSEDTYGSSLDKLMYCIGQGSCAVPILRAMLNQIILAALDEKFDWIRLVTVDGVEEHIRPDDSFTDETTCGATDEDVKMEPVHSPVNELSDIEETPVACIEKIIQFFLDLGHLPSKKCAWFIIAHCWKDSKVTLLLPKDSH
jgi:hypothetical protein